MCVWRVLCDRLSGGPYSVVPRYSDSTGAYGFFRPSMLRPCGARSSGCGVCGRSLLIVACEEPSTLLILDCDSMATIARLETEERELAEAGDESGSHAAQALSGRFTRFKRRYGMAMCAQLYRVASESSAATAPSSAAERVSHSNDGDACTGCELYAVCGMESGHVAVFRSSVPAGRVTPPGAEQQYVLACPLVGEVKLHDEPGQLTAIRSPRSESVLCCLRALTVSVCHVVVCFACAVLAVRLCLSDAASSSVRPASGECGVLCVTGSPSAVLHPLYIAHARHSSAVIVSPLEPVQLSMDDSLSSASLSASSSSSSSSVHRGVNFLAWCCDRQLLATAGWDGRVRLFSVSEAPSHSPPATIRLLAVLRFHTAGVQSVAFAPVGSDAPTHQQPADSSSTASNSSVIAKSVHTPTPTVSPAPSPASLFIFSHSSSVPASSRSLLLSSVGSLAALLASGGDDHRIALYSLPRLPQ